MRLQILDCDYVMINGKPVVRLFCKDESGESVCVFTEGHLPYFYLDVDEKHDLNNVAYEIERQGLNFEIVSKFLPIGYQKKKKQVIKIIGRDPSKTPDIREWSKKFGTPYEADILFKYRFMIDHGLKGMGWIEVDGKPVRTSTVRCKAIEAISIKPIDVMRNAPLKYLAIDTESIIERGVIAEYDKDPISMISMVFSPEHRGRKSITLLTKKTKVEGAISCESEEDMLKKFRDILINYDPDMIVGYNIENYDMPYILKRLEVNKVPRDIGRSEKQAFTKKFAASQRTSICGRVIIDPYYIIRYLSVYDQPHRFTRFDLNTVSKAMLNKSKIEVGNWSDMVKLWKGTQKDLEKFIDYCRTDSELALELVTSRKVVDMNKFIEMSKLCGLLLEDVMAGQAARHENALLHELVKKDIIMPCKPKRNYDESGENKFKGATVLEPDVGLHADGCVMVLDFKSMYPSMIMHYNICPSVLIKDSNGMKESDFTVSPIGAKFAKKSLREGIFPYVARHYFDTRGEVKKLMKKERDEGKIKILDAKQYALKGMLVSLWGYIGFIGAKFYVPEVAASITAWGRENIAKTKKLVEDNFDAKVVYGDTDSVFVKTKITDLDQASKLGDEIAAFVTERLEGLELQSEKLFKRFLILSKKRYAAWSFEKVDGIWKEKIEMKGIETIRRDWCRLTTKIMRNVLETILKEGDISKATKHVRSIVHDLGHGAIPLEDLTVVKGITKPLDRYDAVQPHVEVAKKILKRDPTKANMVGERLGYVIIKGNQMLSKRAEDPDFVKSKGLEIDAHYYIDNQLLPPLERIFDACGINRSELLDGCRQQSLFEILSQKQKGPEETVLEGFDSVVCKKCDWSFRRPSLIGVCPKCSSQLYFASNGSIGKFIKNSHVNVNEM